MDLLEREENESRKSVVMRGKMLLEGVHRSNRLKFFKSLADSFLFSGRRLKEMQFNYELFV